MSSLRNIDTYYIQINDLLLLVQGYTEIESLSDIIRMCRLKPYNKELGIVSRKIKPASLYRQWVDEYGNLLTIDKRKQLDISFSAVSINHSKLIITDLYYGLSIRKIYLMSKAMLFLAGQELQNDQLHYILAFIGLDNFLRVFAYIDNEWQIISPLYLGVKTLKQITNCFREIQFPFYKRIKQSETMIFPCNGQKAWLGSCPTSEEMRRVLMDNNILDLIEG